MKVDEEYWHAGTPGGPQDACQGRSMSEQEAYSRGHTAWRGVRLSSIHETRSVQFAGQWAEVGLEALLETGFP